MPTVLSATTQSAKTIPVDAETAGKYRALIVIAAVGNLTPTMRHSYTSEAAPRVVEHLGTAYATGQSPISYPRSRAHRQMASAPRKITECIAPLGGKIVTSPSCKNSFATVGSKSRYELSLQSS